jgi:hypothetical protein
VNESDPLTAILAWALTAILRQFAGDKIKDFPITLVALLAAVFIRGFITVAEGNALTVDTLLRGVLAGLAAIATHATVRDLQKKIAPPAEA